MLTTSNYSITTGITGIQDYVLQTVRKIPGSTRKTLKNSLPVHVCALTIVHATTELVKMGALRAEKCYSGRRGRPEYMYFAVL
jgi:hypothetical protein